MSGSPDLHELSLSWGTAGDPLPRLIIPLVQLDSRTGQASAVLDPWRKLVAEALDAALVVDPTGRVVAISQSCAALLGDYGVDQLLGQHVLDVLELVDFHASATPSVQYADRIPPLLALAGNTLARGLLRIRRTGESPLTIDAVAAPLHDEHRTLVGAVAFLNVV